MVFERLWGWLSFLAPGGGGAKGWALEGNSNDPTRESIIKFHRKKQELACGDPGPLPRGPWVAARQGVLPVGAPLAGPWEGLRGLCRWTRVLCEEDIGPFEGPADGSSRGIGGFELA